MIVVENKEELKKLIKQRIEVLGPNCDLNDIDVSHITDMSGIFRSSTFNGDISAWDVSNVTNMRGMFQYSDFNGDISNWDTSNVKDMRGIFYGSIFKGDISKWDTSSVEDLRDMLTVFYEPPLYGKGSDWYGYS